MVRESWCLEWMYADLGTQIDLLNREGDRHRSE